MLRMQVYSSGGYMMKQLSLPNQVLVPVYRMGSKASTEYSVLQM